MQPKTSKALDNSDCLRTKTTACSRLAFVHVWLYSSTTNGTKLIEISRVEYTNALRFLGDIENSAAAAMGDIVAMNVSTHSDNYVGLAAEIVSAYVSNNIIEATDIAALIHDVHTAIIKVTSSITTVTELPKPAVAPRRSVTSDYIICLEDGKRFKSLKRHLRSHYNLTPKQYREKWGLSSDYPMVAPNYAEARSALAKRMGLGQQRRRQAS